MRRTVRITAALAAAAALGACGSDSVSTSSIELAVTYPGSAAEVSTNSLHFWVLAPRATVDGGGPPGCGALVAGDVEPYDYDYERLADLVVITAEAAGGLAEEVPRGDVLIYAEAVDFVGRTHLAGCVPLAMAAPAESVSIPLRTPGTFDCDDPDAVNGSLCDDGLYCTIGETCENGTCGDGGPRDCTFVADQCNAESCDEELGCQAAPLPDGRTCEDGLFCTAGDACQDGACEAGPARDCSSADGVCRVGVCNELSDVCSPTIDTELSCSDGLFCTQVDSCSAGGSCLGSSPVNCAAATNDCNLGSCSEGDSGACIQTARRQGLSCNTNCTSAGLCDTGLCTGGTPLAPGTTEGPLGDASCADFIDNDCDGAFDAADTDCQ